MNLIEPILSSGRKIVIKKNSSLYRSIKLNLDVKEVVETDRTAFVKSAWLASDGKIYYFILFNEVDAVSSTLVCSSDILAN